MFRPVTVHFALLFSVAALGRGQEAFNVFRPPGYGSLVPLQKGRGPDPDQSTFHLTAIQTESEHCEGKHDVLSVTLSAPIVGDVSADDFEIWICEAGYLYDDYGYNYQRSQDYDPCEYVVPACARLLAAADQREERRTIEVYGPLAKFDGNRPGRLPNSLDVLSFTVVIDGNRTWGYGNHRDGRWHPSGGHWSLYSYNRFHPNQPLGYTAGPFLADIVLLDLSDPGNSATADTNGCAASHPSATHAVRLFFASRVHERGGDGPNDLMPSGANATEAAALFSLFNGTGDTASPDTVVGVADVDDDNVVDVCIRAAGKEAQVEAVMMQCTASAPLSPAGNACGIPIKAFVRSWADRRAGRDRQAAMEGQRIEFCVSWGTCPGTPADPPDWEGYYFDYWVYEYEDGSWGITYTVSSAAWSSRTPGPMMMMVIGLAALLAIGVHAVGLGVGL